MLFLGSFKDVLRKFQGYLNKVSRKFRKKVSRMNQESLNEVSFAFLYSPVMTFNVGRGVILALTFIQYTTDTVPSLW